MTRFGQGLSFELFPNYNESRQILTGAAILVAIQSVDVAMAGGIAIVETCLGAGMGREIGAIVLIATTRADRGCAR